MFQQQNPTSEKHYYALPFTSLGFLKVSSAHSGYIYLIKNTVKGILHFFGK